MGNLVFQATLGGQVNLVGPNTASTYNINVPAVAGNLVTTGDTGTVTNVMLAASSANIAGNVSSGAYSYGTLSYSDVNIFASYSNSTNNYVQVITQNTSNTNAASVDYVVSNNLGNATAYYGDFGMNSAAWTGNATTPFNVANMVYLTSTSAPLAIGSTGNNAVYIASNATTAVTIDTNQNMGLGVTPSAWKTGNPVLQIGNGQGALEGISTAINVWNNLYRNSSSQFIYQTTNGAGLYSINSGVHSWLNAPSGTAGTAASLTQAMTLDASGNLVVGDTTANRAGASHGISVNGTSSSVLEANYSAGRAGYVYSYSAGTLVGEFRNLPLVFNTNDTERARIDTSGNLGIGCTSLVGSGSVSIKAGQSLQWQAAGASTVYGDIYTDSSNNMVFRNGSAPTERMRIDSSGNLLVGGTTSPSSGSGSVLVESATGGVGYGTGAGGTVTQGTSRTTGVTLNKPTGAITLFTAAGSITATTFTVTNSVVAATDVVHVCQKSGTNVYITAVTAVAAGSFNITFYTTGGVASDAPVFNFTVIKGATS